MKAAVADKGGNPGPGAYKIPSTIARTPAYVY
jgi:hypothetical protein